HPGILRRRAAGNRPAGIETPDGKQQLQEVGAAEGSHFSQGHYRLYFGLGEHETIESVKIVWPDGTQQSIEPPSVDQLWTVTYPSRKKSMI
ncbi:MAG: ASPIC/UnbV domain-containing protein, partial [Synechococcales cyanobacterium T60_A2020_003]|nr:ASPIC/UnbV domain-containing protein [Synechococcales cyanobacterium T60_A2020_003]